MLALLIATALSGAAAEQKTNCAADTAAMLKLSPYEFDQTGKGFRSLPPGCDVTTANLIATYRRANWGKLDQNAVQVSYWHEGQSRAFAGETEMAIPLLLAGVNPGVAGLNDDLDASGKAIGMANAEYALATVAFLQRDLQSLKSARTRLTAVPQPPAYKEFLKTVPSQVSRSAQWPPNLNIVDGLIACFEKPYRVAYGCGSK